MQTKRNMPRYGRTPQTLDISRQPGYGITGTSGGIAPIEDIRNGEYLKGR